jgi:iron complex outermembrane receptor protein
VSVGTNLRQRQNLGQARIQGIEGNAGWRIARDWLIAAGYTLAVSRVTAAPGQPQLVGKQLPQDPRHRASFSAALDDPRRFTVQAQVRYVGLQFEDDVNALPMSGALLVDLFGSWHVTRYLELFVAVDNLFDKAYLVGRSGIDTVGPPRFVHGGLRLRTAQ